MPIIVSKEELLEKEDFFIRQMINGKIFIYPTDTIYGIGCNAANKEVIKKIKKIKNRDSKPFSIIIPGLEWIKENCLISEEKYLKIQKLLPGAYTFILNKKIGGTIGVRIPKHYFSSLVEKSGISFITTSVNLSGEKSVIKFVDIPESIYNQVDYIVKDDLSLSGKGSTIMDFTGANEVIIRK